MPHQAHGIRWDTLIDNLKYQHGDAFREVPCDIVFGFKEGQGKAVNYFAESFKRNLTEHTKTERRKYPAQYEAPNPDDVIIDDRTAKRINKTVYKWQKSARIKAVSPESPDLCPHHSDTSEARKRDDPLRRSEQQDAMSWDCACPLPFKERRGAAFLRGYTYNGCGYFPATNGAAFMNLHVMMTLLLHGEMDPVLRACAHPEIDYKTWHHKTLCYDVPNQVGWSELYQPALDAYLVLNIIDSFPELWDPRTGCKRQEAGSWNREDEYRNTATYQRMLRWCTQGAEYDLPTYPHRDFFGLAEDHFHYLHYSFDIRLAHQWPAFAKLRNNGDWWLLSRKKERIAAELNLERKRMRPYEFPFGHAPFDIFLNCKEEVPFCPSTSDTEDVSSLLYNMGLPMELIYPILSLAGHDEPKRRLPVAHDPLHPSNRQELNKYMIHCWLTLVRCNMLAQELGIAIDWNVEIFWSLKRTVGVAPGRKLYKRGFKIADDNTDWEFYTFRDKQGREGFSYPTTYTR